MVGWNFLICWYLTGLIFYVLILYTEGDDITLGDLVVGLFFSIIGPIIIIIYLICITTKHKDKVIFKRDKNK